MMGKGLHSPRSIAEVEAGTPIDLGDCPYTTAGSWWSLAWRQPPSGRNTGTGLYLQTNRSTNLVRRPMLRLRPTAVEDGPHDWQLVGDGLHCPGADIQIRAAGIDAEDCWLLQGGTPLQLEAVIGYGTIAHPVAADAWLLNLYASHARIHLLRQRGAVRLEQELHADGRASDARRIRFIVEPDHSGSWAIALRPCQSDCPATPAPDRATSAAERDAAWQAWRARFPAPRGYDDRRWSVALRILWASILSPDGQLTRRALAMSRQNMDQVWSWDYCFFAAALAAGDGELAMEQWLLFADHQSPSGAYPDSVGNLAVVWNFTKPPVQALLWRWTRERHPDFITADRLAAWYATTAANVRWYLAHRRWPGHTLCHYLHGNDSGWDNSTLFDAGVPLVAPDLNAYLVAACEELADSAMALGRPDAEVLGWREQADELTRAIEDELWNGDRYVARHLPDGQAIAGASLQPAMLLAIGARLRPERVAVLLELVRAHDLPYGLATEHPDGPHFDGDGYWRGPAWAPSTFLVVQALIRLGESAPAARLAERFRAACHQGFAENCDPRDGVQRRDPAYTWTAGVYLELTRWLASRESHARLRSAIPVEERGS